MSGNQTQKRPWFAAVLAVIYPGLGHVVYLREWLRGAMWFGFAIATAWLFVPPETITAVQSGGLGAYIEASRTLPMEAVLPILAVQVFNIVDAYWLTLQRNRRAGDDRDLCPACGKPLDADLNFCQWCTTRLDEVSDPESGLTSR